jgi:hypothetical protein
MARFLLVVVLCAVPAVVSAQTWADAYRAGNYQKAAELLQQIVIETGIRDVTTVDPEPPAQLALMYAQGQGVAGNAITACTLARTAEVATHMRPVPGLQGEAFQARLDASGEFMRRHCDPLTAEDRRTAELSVGCVAFGMPEETITLGGQSVRIGRRGIALANTEEEPWELLNCPQLVARVRATSLAPPSDAASGVGPRHFVDVFTWVGGTTREGTTAYSLRWDVYEVREKRIRFYMVAQDLLTRTAWPGRDLPAEIEKGLTLEMIRSGHVRWKFESAPPKRGWIMLDGEVTR